MSRSGQHGPAGDRHADEAGRLASQVQGEPERVSSSTTQEF